LYSIVIPAHNEAAVIERCLKALTEGLEHEDTEIIVVCNGCSDNTADLARRVEGVKVVELETPSKVLALNTGDEMASGFPIAYVDADIEITGKDLLLAFKSLEKTGVEIVSPQLVVSLERSNVWVRAFYRVWMKLPYFTHGHMVGSGIYILSEQGRSRFEKFPEIIADDGYVRALFSPSERLTAKDCMFRIFAPQNLTMLVKIKSRVRFGNLELNKKYPELSMGGENKPGAFLGLMLSKPWLIPSGLVYFYVQYMTKVNSKKRFERADFSTWERDESSRC